MDDLTKRIGVGVLAAAFAYFAFLPLVWPEPVVAAEVPTEATMRSTIPISVSVSAWHRNVDIGHVRFFVDYTATTAVGPKGTFNPEIIVERTPRQFIGALARNPITFPYTQRIESELDLGKYAEQQLIGPGELIGKIDVTFNYCSGRGGKMRMRDRTRTTTQSVPFRIAIRE